MRIFAPLALSSLLSLPCTIAQCLDAWSEQQCADILALESSACDTYHIFMVRGTDAKVPGRMGELVRQTCEQLSEHSSNPNETVTCGYESVEYSAKSRFVNKQSWCISAAEGAVAGQKQMQEYGERCPSSKMILIGFSQGASVALDMVGGGGGKVFECEQDENAALNRDTAPGSKIVAVAVFGAVRRSANQPYSIKGGASFNGQAARSEEQLRGLDQYADILADYCNKGDFICAVGSEPGNLENHLSYFDLYNEEAAEWIAKTSLGPFYKRKGILESIASHRVTLPCDSLTLGVVGAIIFGFVAFHFGRRFLGLHSINAALAIRIVNRNVHYF